MGLFSSSKDPAPQQPPRPAPTRSSEASGSAGSMLGAKIVVDGKITGDENLYVEGTVKGGVDLNADLRVGKNARIDAKVHARNIIVEGTVNGDISADARVELVNGAHVDGNIKAPKVVVAEGAIFRGSVDMGSKGKESKPAEAKEKS